MRTPYPVRGAIVVQHEGGSESVYVADLDSPTGFAILGRQDNPAVERERVPVEGRHIVNQVEAALWRMLRNAYVDLRQRRFSESRDVSRPRGGNVIEDEVQVDPKEIYEGWSILELMGHRRLAGYVREQEIAGQAFLRIDVPGSGEELVATQYYGAAAIYCLTPTTEEVARSVATLHRPAPVQRWELPAVVEGPHDEDDESELVLAAEWDPEG